MILEILYIIIAMIAMFVMGFVKYHDMQYFDVSDAGTSVLMGALWPIMLVFLIPYAGAWISKRSDP